MAIDDFSLSPECFGINIPSSELNGYNYWDAMQILPTHKNEPHTDFINATCQLQGDTVFLPFIIISFTSCRL